MTSKDWEDICISFDEYGMQPATLCENEEAVIQSFRKAFKEVLHDLEVLEILKHMLEIKKGNTWWYLDTKHPFFDNEGQINKIKEWLENGC